jgi:hypothetical protein
MWGAAMDLALLCNPRKMGRTRSQVFDIINERMPIIGLRP